MKLIYLKSALKCDSFDVAIGIKIPFFRVMVSIEPGRSLLQFVTTNRLMTNLLSANLLFFATAKKHVFCYGKKRGCSLFNVLLFALKFDSFSQL